MTAQHDPRFLLAALVSGIGRIDPDVTADFFDVEPGVLDEAQAITAEDGEYCGAVLFEVDGVEYTGDVMHFATIDHGDRVEVVNVRPTE